MWFGGIKVNEPSLDLAIIACVASSYKNISIKVKLKIFILVLVNLILEKTQKKSIVLMMVKILPRPPCVTNTEKIKYESEIKIYE